MYKLSGGFVKSVVKELSEIMNFTIDITKFAGASGTWKSFGEVWSEMIDVVAKGEFDLGASTFVFSKARYEVVDFTQTIMSDHRKFFFKQPDGAAFAWSQYFQVSFNHL